MVQLVTTVRVAKVLYYWYHEYFIIVILPLQYQRVMEARSWYSVVTLMLEQELTLYFVLNVNLLYLLCCHEKYEWQSQRGDKPHTMVCTSP